MCQLCESIALLETASPHIPHVDRVFVEHLSSNGKQEKWKPEEDASLNI